MQASKVTGITPAHSLRHEVIEGTPYQDHDDPELLTLMLDTVTNRIAVEGTPDELRRLATAILSRLDRTPQLHLAA